MNLEIQTGKTYKTLIGDTYRIVDLAEIQIQGSDTIDVAIGIRTHNSGILYENSITNYTFFKLNGECVDFEFVGSPIVEEIKVKKDEVSISRFLK